MIPVVADKSDTFAVNMVASAINLLDVTHSICNTCNEELSPRYMLSELPAPAGFITIFPSLSLIRSFHLQVSISMPSVSGRKGCIPVTLCPVMWNGVCIYVCGCVCRCVRVCDLH